MDIQPNTYAGLRELALFAGAGGGIQASRMLGWRTVCAVEWDDYASNALVARQNHEAALEAFPIWSDVQTFDGRPWRGIVDVVSGGFPCQDISAAGKGAGIDGERSGMWSHFARIIGEVRPKYAFIENSPMLVTRGLDRVLSDLAALGFNAQWGCISASEVGANHGRDRIWIVANANEYASAAPQRGIMGEKAAGQRGYGTLHAAAGHAGGASGHQRAEPVLGFSQVTHE